MLDRRDVLKGFGAAAVGGLFAGCRVEAAEPVLQTTGALQSDKVIAGSSRDFMIARHVVLRGSNRAIGHDLTQLAITRHDVRPSKEDPLAVQARRLFFERNYPIHMERSRGAADALKVRESDTTVDVTEVGYNMDPGIGCSVVYYPGSATQSGHPTLSRNFDFSAGTINQMAGLPEREPKNRPMCADPYVIEAYPDKGYASLYVSCYDMLGGCIDGVNSEGLCVALLADDYSMNKYGNEPARLAAGLGVLQVGRYLLDTCKNVEEAKIALKAAKQYYTVIPCHYIIGDAKGSSFVWEYSHRHSNEYITDGGGGPQTITNHPLFLDEAEVRSFSNSYNRQKQMQAEIRKAGGRLSADQIKNTNSCVAAAIPHDNGRTMWHAVYDCTARSMEVSFYLGDDINGIPLRSSYAKIGLS